MGDTDLPTVSPTTSSTVTINPSKDFDLETYISSYTSHTKIQRLLFIAAQCGTPTTTHNTQLQQEAYKICLEELRTPSGQNTQWYREIVKLIKEKGFHHLLLSGTTTGTDNDVEGDKWADEVDKRAKKHLERLEADLGMAKTNLIKESVRMGYLDIGNFHLERGELSLALKSYVRTRDYCTTSKHLLHMCLKVLIVSVLSSNWTHVINYVSKAEHALETTHETSGSGANGSGSSGAVGSSGSNNASGSNGSSAGSATTGGSSATGMSSEYALVASKLKCFSGLANLEAKKYKLAARKFLEATFDIYNNFSEIMSANDVAVYGGLCALATFDRTELKKKVLDNQNFKQFLELVPEIREIVYSFYHSQYCNCLQLLDKIRNELIQFDIYLSSHISQLYDKIRNKALIQYFSPFISVNLKEMALSFQTTIEALEREIETLIMTNQIQARIDSQNKILYARQVDQRSTTYRKVIELGDDYQKNTKSMLLRLNMLRNNNNNNHKNLPGGQEISTFPPSAFLSQKGYDDDFRLE